jgi:HSP20 family protein
MQHECIKNENKRRINMSFLIPSFHRSNGWLQDFDHFFENIESNNNLSLTADIEDSPEYILMSFDLPGMKDEDLTVKVEGEQLFISGERKREDTKSEKSNVYFNQRRYGKFQKVYSLPENIDSKKIEADYRHGVLRVYLPKVEVKKAEAVNIPVKAKDSFLDRLWGSVSQH